MIKLYLDEDVHKKTAHALRIKGYDVVSAHEIKNWGISDSEQLNYAIKERRAIFSFNAADFIKLHNKYINNKQKHFGIILSKQIPLKETISRLTKFLYNNFTKDISNTIIWLP